MSTAQNGSAPAALPPGPSWTPISGTLRWMTRPLAMVEACRARYGDAFTVRFLHEGTVVMVSHPEDIKRIFTADPAIVHAGEHRELMKAIFGENSLVCLDEEDYARQRRLLLPPFHGERLAAYAELIAEITRAELAGCELGTPIRFAELLRAIALETILRAVFGTEDPARAVPIRDAISDLFDLTSSLARMGPLMLLGPARAPRVPTVRRLMDRVDELIFAEVDNRRAEGGLDERPDVLSILMTTRHEDGSEMTSQEIRDELLTLLIGGHETTATALSWAVEFLSHFPAVAARLRADVAAGGTEYLDAVVKETLRARPVLPVTSRLLKAPLELREYTIPAETIVSVCSYLTHHRPELYPDPYAFRPERFLGRNPGTYEWVPFGGGVRHCIGRGFAAMEMRTVLGVISEELIIKPIGTSHEMVGRRAITLVPKGGCEVVCERSPRAAVTRAR
jgi:cytochrome P450